MATFFKVVVLGDGGIGKTSICNFFTTGEFFGSYKLSIGADFFSKKLIVNGEEVTLQICDIGGQDQFAEISNIFTKGAHGAILCYDITRRETLDSLDRWIQKLEDTNIPKILVSTKNDVEDLREVFDEDGIEIAKKMNIPYYIPTTSLKGIGITETFEAISKLMLINKKGLEMPVTEMVDVNHPNEIEIPTISRSQHISAQPLGIGRVPTGFEEEKESDIIPPLAPTTPFTNSSKNISPPIVEPIEEAKPSFTRPITLKPPIVPTNIKHKEDSKLTQKNRDTSIVEPPTDPEKTATQPISTITPPLSEKKPSKEEEKPKIEQRSKFSFLDRLKEERKKVSLEKDK